MSGRLTRVCLTGAECTGKSSLAAALAEHYGATLVPECSRMHFEAKISRGDAMVTTGDVVSVARLQAECEDRGAATARELLICDTDVFTIAVWNERFLLTRSLEADLLAEDRNQSDARIDLYLLCAPDIPWVPDGLRSHAELRQEMHLLFRHRLEETGRPYVLVEGDMQKRFTTAVTAIDALLAGRRD